MIPRIFHRVWVGGSMPADLARLGDSWLQHNPGWEMRLWTDNNLPVMRNQAIYDRASELVESRLLGRFKSNLIRLEVLEQFGGVYVDCDFEALKPIPKRFQNAECFVARETPQFVNNGIIGAEPAHPFITSVIDAIPESVESQPGKPSNVTTGPHLLTKLLTRDVKVIPTKQVYPYLWRDAYNETEVSTKGAWAHHLWAGSRWQVSVIVPFRGGCPYRERSRDYVVARLQEEHPDWQITEVDSSGEFSRAEAIMRGIEKSFGRIIVVHDSDSWDEQLPMAIEEVKRDRHKWAIPHHKIHRLTEEQSDRFMDDDENTDINDTHENPYKGTMTGGICVFRRDVIEQIPPDVRFRGWGGEDAAWGHALKTLIGGPWRGTKPLIHLWHPAAPRISRSKGSEENNRLMMRYLDSQRSKALMQVLISEAKDEWARLQT
jgi:inositol phosphorylceramide mannosyltransferase catalytic subunit